jgi:hypothetical protein
MRIHALHLVVVYAAVAAVATVRADWAGVAATAAIDEGDVGKVVFNNDGSAGIRSTISSTSAKLRLTVPETPSFGFQIRDPTRWAHWCSRCACATTDPPRA